MYFRLHVACKPLGTSCGVRAARSYLAKVWDHKADGIVDRGELVDQANQWMIEHLERERRPSRSRSPVFVRIPVAKRAPAPSSRAAVPASFSADLAELEAGHPL